MSVAVRLAIGLTLGLAACDTDPCAGRRDPVLSPGGLALVEEEHPAGWGQETCAQCHVAFTLHDTTCSEVADIDLAEIDALADLEDPVSCVPCHGSNGVAEWEPEITGDEP